MSAVKPLAQVQLGTAETLIYTAQPVPVNAMTIVKSIWICNTSAAVRAVTLRYGKGTLTAANSIMEQAALPAKTSWYLDAADSSLTLGAGARLAGLSDVAAAVTITVSGEETQ